jgi:predicted adenine nucleotide alpha hydrolase (AANH) superfamily ATPase
MKLLLHTCCAPCSAAIIEYLLEREIRPTLFYFNPNIYPKEEYEIRKNECSRYARQLKLEIIDGDYDHDLWLKSISGLEKEPECGKRCSECFRMRLSAAARLANEKGFDTIATTLGSSRWKNLEQIAEAGRQAVAPCPDLAFWDKNWRKGGLSERRRILLKENEFYNQKYCGCEFGRFPGLSGFELEVDATHPSLSTTVKRTLPTSPVQAVKV